MQFLSSFVSSSVRSLPYIEDASESSGVDLPGGWFLHKGLSSTGVNTTVSLFKFDKKQNQRLIPTAENLLKRTKTLRHPHLLRKCCFMLLYV